MYTGLTHNADRTPRTGFPARVWLWSTGLVLVLVACTRYGSEPGAYARASRCTNCGPYGKRHAVGHHTAEPARVAEARAVLSGTQQSDRAWPAGLPTDA